MSTKRNRPAGNGTAHKAASTATRIVPDAHCDDDPPRGYRLLDGGTAPESLDALDRTDLLWFVRHPDVAERTRRTRPAEADFLAASSDGRRPRSVTVRRVGVGFLIRDYGPAGLVVAVVSPGIVREVFR